MKALDKKLLRDLWRMKTQVLTVTLIVAIGVASYVGTSSTYRSLISAREHYYESAKLADVFGTIQRAPERVLAELSAIDGVSIVEGRVTDVLRVKLPNKNEPVRGQFISAPRTFLNALNLRRGHPPERTDEAVVSEIFADANHLMVGDSVDVVVGGRLTRVVVCGMGVTPEFLWVMDPSGLSFNVDRYAVFWMRHDALAAALGMQGAFNSVALALSPGAQSANVVDQVERILSAWGSFGAHDRSKLHSHRMVNQELGQLRGTALLLPPIFLGVAAFLLSVVLSRLVNTQRQQIASLKALGYTHWRVATHYLKLALSMVFLGIVVGLGLGVWVGQIFLDMYAEYFRFPNLRLELNLELVLTSLVITLGSAIAGALRSVRLALSLAPAEAMRAESPRSFRANSFERLQIHQMLSVMGRMVLRDLERQPVRVVFSALGICFATSLLVVAYGSFDSMDILVERQFESVQREDMTLRFTKSLPPSVLTSLRGLPGVLAAEGQRIAPVRVRAAHRSREVPLIVAPDKLTLRRWVDASGSEFFLPRTGLAMSKVLAELLNVAPGQVLDVEILEGKRIRKNLVLSAVVDDYVGLSLYAQEHWFVRAMDESRMISEVMLKIDDRQRDVLWPLLMNYPMLAGLAQPKTERDAFAKRVLDVFFTFQTIIALFAMGIAIAVVFNNARIAYVTKARELATLRILGFSRLEIESQLVVTQVVQLLLGIPLGLLIGRQIVSLALSATDVELYRLPVAIAPQSYATAALVTLATGLLSALWVARSAKNMNLVGVLKAAD